MVTVEIEGERLQIRNQKWTGGSDALVSLLNNWTETRIETATSDDPLFNVNSPEDPYPDLTIAEEAIKVWGGKIIDEGDAPEYDPDVIY